MLRRGLAVLMAVGVTYVVTSPQARERPRPRETPPSSLEPGAPRGKVRLSHNHRRIVTCFKRKKKGAGLRCRSRRENAPSGTDFTLQPVSSPDIEGDRRAPVRISFPNDPGRQERWVELAVGDWEVRWDQPPYKRFRVNDGDEFKVWLRSVSGRCELREKRSECVLRPTEHSRHVVIQNGHGAG